jgi:hypothetical protein
MKINKQIIISVFVTALIAGTVAFYGGRYYENQSRRNSFQNKMGGNQMYRQNRVGETQPNNQ